MKLIRKIAAALLVGAFALCLYPHQALAYSASNPLVVCLDPGHGQWDSGAVGNGYVEKNLNLRIAQGMRDELSKYTGVKVVMTRTGDGVLVNGNTSADLHARVNYAVRNDADVFVSLHVNAGGGNGFMVLAQNNSSYNATQRDISVALARKALQKLSVYGLPSSFIYQRDYPAGEGEYYPDGHLADYYAVLRHSRRAGIPAILIEHGYIDNAYNARRLYANDGAYQLGVKDAQALAEYYGLTTSSSDKSARLAGSTRYGTMKAIVDTAWGSGSSSNVVLASATNWPDALTASSLAGGLQAPVVMTDPSSLSSEAQSEIQRVGAKNVYVMGGPAAVSDNVVAQLQRLGLNVVRVAGDVRSQTAVKAYETLAQTGGVSDTCLLAAGTSYADALAASAYSYAAKAPIFLAEDDGSISSATLAAMQAGGFKKIVVLGGTGFGGSIQDATAQSLASTLGASWIRLAGADRIQTSIKIATWETGRSSESIQPSVVLSWSRPAIAYAWNFPDALSSASLCGRNASPVLLVDGGSGSKSSVGALLSSCGRGNAQALYILGGKTVMPSWDTESYSDSLGW